MKILLVEDDTVLVEALVRALTAEHYTVDVATDGQVGLELASGSIYEVILLYRFHCTGPALVLSFFQQKNTRVSG